jgi:hypothetical protein
VRLEGAPRPALSGRQAEDRVREENRKHPAMEQAMESFR